MPANSVGRRRLVDRGGCGSVHRYRSAQGLRDAGWSVPGLFGPAPDAVPSRIGSRHRDLVERDRVRVAVVEHLPYAVPRVRQWRHAALRYLATKDLKRVPALPTDATAKGLRDRAMLLLLGRLGRRVGEVVRLELEDVDWRAGNILIRAGKTRRERILPLPHDAGDALVHYLKDGRPVSSHRPCAYVFRHTIATHRRNSGLSNSLRKQSYFSSTSATPSALAAFSKSLSKEASGRPVRRVRSR